MLEHDFVRLVSSERLVEVLQQLSADDPQRPILEAERQRRRADAQRRAHRKHQLEWDRTP